MIERRMRLGWLVLCTAVACGRVDGSGGDGGTLDGPVVDAGLIDSANPSCDDGQRNQGEGDIDCGGPCALKCTPNQHCRSETDCTTGVCAETFCTLASGPPFWVGSTGLPTYNGAMGAGGARGTIWVLDGTRSAFWTGTGWTENPSGADNFTLPIATLNHAIVGDGETFWSLGGRDADPERNSRAVALPPAATTWTNVANLSVARSLLAGAIGPDGKLYALGGNVGVETEMSSFSAVVESYTPPAVAPGDQAWDGTPPDLPFGIYDLAAAAVGDSLYVVGGTAFTGRLAAAYRWKPGDVAWTPVADMPAARARHRAVGASDGRLYVVGGWDGTIPLGTVLAYSPQANHWFSLPALGDPRYHFGLVVGPDGRIWSIGGVGAASLGTVEIYGPELDIDPVDGPAGTQIQIGGSNFAASATVSVHVDTLESAAVGTAQTSPAGGMLTPIVYTVPVGTPAGTQIVIHAIDNRSLFPVRRVFTVE
jgi:Kelch motif